MYEMIKKSKASDTIQCVRKRVRGSGTSIEKTDLFYDKSDTKYYFNMRELGFARGCRIYQDEYKEYEKWVKDDSKDRSPNTIFLAKLADGTAYIKPQISRVRDMGIQSAAVSGQQTKDAYKTPLYSGRLVSVGIEEIAPPPVVRLYSEAEMTHASTLAKNLTSPARYSAFRRIGYEDLPDAVYAGVNEPLIKATEYDDRAHVMGRYSSNQKSQNAQTKDAFMQGRELAVKHMKRYGGNVVLSDQDRQIILREKAAEIVAATGRVIAAMRGKKKVNIALISRKIEREFLRGYDVVRKGWDAFDKQLSEREGHSSLEVSYGGKTGDMTAEHTSHPYQRQYSLIQSTFFWLPGVDSIVNARAMLQFFLAHFHKLEPGGIIRLVSFSNNEESRDGNRENKNTDWRKTKNQYGKAADWVCAQLQRHEYYIDVRKTLLYDRHKQSEKQSYATRLSELGLNPKHGDQPTYRPLWTDTRRIVNAGGEENGNLILQARRRRIFRP